MNKRWKRGALGVIPVLFVLLVVCPGRGMAAAKFTIDFNDVEIRKVIETVSEITGKNFIVDDRVQGRVTVIGPRSLSSAEVYQVFLSILQVKGYAVVPAGRVSKIVPTANVSGAGFEVKVGDSEERWDIDNYVTQIIPLEYTEAEDVKNLLQPLIPKTDSITAYGPTNILILTTTESLLKKLSQVISVVDVAGAREEVRIIPVEFAPVEELAGKINQIIEGQSGSVTAVQRAARGRQPAQPSPPSAQTRIIPDDRTNSIIAIGDAQTLDRIEEMIKKLDVAVPKGAGKVHVYYLQNADAGELAKVLTGIPIEESLPQTAAAPGQPPAAVRAKQPGTEISIIADESTNSLVITATSEEYEAIKNVIEQLDIPRDQVLVEVLIAEVLLTRTMDFGVDWRVADDVDSDLVVFGGSGFGDLDALSVSFPSTPSGLAVGAIGETISFNIGGELVEFPSLGALIRALKTDSDVNILSTPTILTMDNREAEIVVGQTVPFQTSQKFDANNQPIFTFDYRDVGITLRLTPQINKNRFVKLDIFSQLEALVSSTLGTTQELAPTTLKRKADTSVVVKDGNTIVIGGLIRDDLVKTVNRVPLLGSIPILGYLFRSESTKTEKTNLLIFLTPHIIANAQDIRDASADKLREMDLLPESVSEKTGYGDGKLYQPPTPLEKLPEENEEGRQ